MCVCVCVCLSLKTFADGRHNVHEQYYQLFNSIVQHFLVQPLNEWCDLRHVLLNSVREKSVVLLAALVQETAVLSDMYISCQRTQYLVKTRNLWSWTDCCKGLKWKTRQVLDDCCTSNKDWCIVKRIILLSVHMYSSVLSVTESVMVKIGGL